MGLPYCYIILLDDSVASVWTDLASAWAEAERLIARFGGNTALITRRIMDHTEDRRFEYDPYAASEAAQG